MSRHGRLSQRLSYVADPRGSRACANALKRGSSSNWPPSTDTVTRAPTPVTGGLWRFPSGHEPAGSVDRFARLMRRVPRPPSSGTLIRPPHRAHTLSATSPASRPGRAGSTSPSSSTSTAAPSSGGRSRSRPTPRSSRTPCDGRSLADRSARLPCSTTSRPFTIAGAHTAPRDTSRPRFPGQTLSKPQPISQRTNDNPTLPSTCPLFRENSILHNVRVEPDAPLQGS